MINICNDLERLADMYMQVGNLIQRKVENKIWFTPDQRSNIKALLVDLENAISLMTQNLESDYDKTDKTEITELVKSIKTRRVEIREEHLKNIGKKDFNVQSSMVYTDLFNSLTRSSDYIMSVTEAMVGEIS